MQTQSKSHLQGFTFLEALISVAVLALMAGAGFALYTNIRQGVGDQKLRKDVSALNAAVKVYVANGGALAGVTDPAVALSTLQTVTAGADRKQIVGLKGSALDHRMRVVMQTPAEAASNSLRAIWDTDGSRFKLAKSGANGVARFVLDESASTADSEEARRTNLQYATEGRWVWDYAHHTTGGGGPANLPPAPNASALPPSPGSPSPSVLSAPIIETPGFSYPLADYPMTVSVSNPNLPATSEVMYSLASGVWSLYSGPITIEPGDTLEVIAVSVDPDHWVDSPSDDETYTVAPISPELDVALPGALDYISLGGALMPGSYPPPTLADPGDVVLANSADIPPDYQSNAYFQIFWTTDDSDPLTSGTRHVGDAFTGGFPGQEIPIALDDFDTADSLTVKVRAQSFDPDILGHSSEDVAVIAVTALPLRAPVITVDEATIEITMLADFGDMPAGARIFYTTDGTDPGVAADNEPVTGTLYSGSFNLDADSELVARVYPPATYAQWFTPSAPTAHTFLSPFLREVYIGGRFALPDGTFRNISRLGEDGAVDFDFNPGLGASYGSTVGVILPQGGGQLLAGGDFDSMDTTHRYGVARLDGDGNVDLSFDAALQ